VDVIITIEGFMEWIVNPGRNIVAGDVIAMAIMMIEEEEPAILYFPRWPKEKLAQIIDGLEELKKHAGIPKYKISVVDTRKETWSITLTA
jgi:hypothetical protein